MVDKNEILRAIQDYAVGNGFGQVTRETNLDSTGMDSLDIAELAQEVETEFDENIKLNRFQVTHETTVGDLVDFFASEIDNPNGEESIYKLDRPHI